MRIGKRTLLLGLIFALAAIVVYLAARNPPAPFLPADEVHAVFVSPEECLSCHGPDGGLPQGPNHPINRQCMSCHAR
jgi:hypothetical protein